MCADGTPVRASNVSAHCQENPKGYEFWKSKLLNGRPENWPPATEKQAKWTPEEMERVLEALGSLPDSLQPKKIKGFYRMHRSDDYPNPAPTRAPTGEIVLFDSAFDQSRNLARILGHELAHIAYRDLSAQDHDDLLAALYRFEFNDASGKKIYIRGRNKFVEEDGKLSPTEDIANDIEYFLFDPKRLKEVTPTAFDWIKMHFGANFKLERVIK